VEGFGFGLLAELLIGFLAPSFSLPLVTGGSGFFAIGCPMNKISNRQMIVVEALRHTEDRIDGLLGHVAASEQRVMRLAAVSAAISALFASNASAFPSPAIVLIASAGMLLVAFRSIWILKPRPVDIKGHTWDGWRGHYEDNDDFCDVLVSQARENDDRIIRLKDELEKLAKSTRRILQMIFLLHVFS